MHPKEVAMATKLYVGNLSYSVTQADLEELFAQAGAVESVNVISDKFSGQSRGFGFVEMASNEAAQAAIQRFDGYDLKGRALKVNEARPQADRSGEGRSRSGSGGGGYRRGGGGGGGGGRERRW
jgi:RNA recognition motif-containing protein